MRLNPFLFLGVLLSLSGCTSVARLSEEEKSLEIMVETTKKLPSLMDRLMPEFADVKRPPNVVKLVNPNPIARSTNAYTPISDIPGSIEVPIALIKPKVKQFIDGFRKGALAPEAFLLGLRKKRPELNSWFNAPKEQRIFLVGFAKDGPAIRAFAEQQKRNGKVIFFFQDCKPLCSHEEVGAMFSSSGEAGLWYDWNAEYSHYVPTERATIQALLGGKIHLHSISLSRNL